MMSPRTARQLDATTAARLALVLMLASLNRTPVRAESPVEDPLADTLFRRMDPGASLPFDTAAHRLPDLVSLKMQAWSPDDPAADLFTGMAAETGDFLRLDIVLAGLANPPGPVDPSDFRPFVYGDHPLYGFIEINMDQDVDTGGELIAPQYRYLGNVARFGGQVTDVELAPRVATDVSAFDDDFESPPQVERHGEEFHLALLGTQFEFDDIEPMAGDADFVFEPGETWNIRGTFFHRAHGYELFSFVEGGRHPGEYAPTCDLRFRHDPAQDRTHVTLIFPLTNAGAGAMRDEPPEPTNQDPTDHASVLEALEDLQLSAFFLPVLPTDLPEEAIIANWAERDPAQHLDPIRWSMAAIIGSSFTAPHPDGVYFVWSDVYPNVVVGDVDGSGEVDGRDRGQIAQYLAQRDGLDGVVDETVTIMDFAAEFTVYDVNHDGFVDSFDLAPGTANGDSDLDGDVDLFDFARFQVCFDPELPYKAGCAALDLQTDLVVTLADLPGFFQYFGGPQED